MRITKNLLLLTVLLIFSLLLTNGCADLTTYQYQLTFTGERSLEFKGDLESTNLRGGRTGNRVKILYSRQIQSSDKQGNVVEKITINELDYLKYIKDKTVLNFKSQGANKENPLSKLVGQSITIESGPAGQVNKVLQTTIDQAALKGKTEENIAAQKLLDPKAIEHLYSMPRPPRNQQAQMKVADSWSNIKSFSFGTLGTKSYERIYTVTKINESDGHRIMLVDMRGVPVPQKAEQAQGEQKKDVWSDISPNAEIYNGNMTFDFATDNTKKYIENCEVEWVIEEPNSATEQDKQPNALIMRAIQIYKVEKVN